MRFWQLDEWKKTFNRHLLATNKLLKIYTSDAILNTLAKNPRFRSLGPSFVIDVVRDEQVLLDNAIKRAGESICVVVNSTNEKPRTGPAPNSIRSKLKGL